MVKISVQVFLRNFPFVVFLLYYDNLCRFCIFIYNLFELFNAGDGIRTREGTHPLGPQPSAFDRSTTPAKIYNLAKN